MQSNTLSKNAGSAPAHASEEGFEVEHPLTIVRGSHVIRLATASRRDVDITLDGAAQLVLLRGEWRFECGFSMPPNEKAFLGNLSR